jgi:hypothetical protein
MQPAVRFVSARPYTAVSIIAERSVFRIAIQRIIGRVAGSSALRPATSSADGRRGGSRGTQPARGACRAAIVVGKIVDHTLDGGCASLL